MSRQFLIEGSLIFSNRNEWKRKNIILRTHVFMNKCNPSVGTVSFGYDGVIKLGHCQGKIYKCGDLDKSFS